MHSDSDTSPSAPGPVLVDAPLPASSGEEVARAWSQVVIRSFASATNLLVPGELFVLDARECVTLPAPVRRLAADLRAFGARVRVLTPFSAEDGAASGGTELPADVDVLPAVSADAPTVETAGERVQAVVRVHPAADRGEAGAPGAGSTGTRDVDGGAVDTGRDREEPSPGVSPRSPATSPARFFPTPQVRTSDGRPLVSPWSAHPAPAAERLAWARAHMPVTRAAVADLAREGLLAGTRIGLSLVLEPKTAVLALELAAAGAEVAVFGHADETREDVAAELRAAGLTVHADSRATADEEERLARDFLGHQLHVLLDDGSHLIRMAHDPDRAPGALDVMVGAAEETTSGLRPLRAWEADGRLAVPVVASNDARSKTLFDNAYGTGQSCLLTALDLLDPEGRGWPLWRQKVLVIGYGDVGRGLARFAAALGARVAVAEVDPVRSLQALMDGHEVGDAVELAADADVVASATGVARTVDVRVLDAMPDGSVAFVAGGVTDEVDLTTACARGGTVQPVAGLPIAAAGRRPDPRLAEGPAPTGTPAPPAAGDEPGATRPAGDAEHEERAMRSVDALTTPDGRRVLVLDGGGCLNCTAGEGNPIEIMDLSFGVQVNALRHLLVSGAELAPGLHPLPAEADTAVAAAALAARGGAQ